MMTQLLDYILTEKIYDSNNIIVHRGYRVSDNLPVIIKQPISEHPDLNYIMKVKHEFKINKLINSPLVCKAYDLFELNNVPILVSEDFGGESIRSLFSTKKISIIAFLKISIKIATAIYAIHNTNLVHNVLTPDNIIINYDTGVVKIINFGEATILTKENKSTNNFHLNKEYLPYTSPEQTGRMNRSIDYRTDFYSLGITLYELLLGLLPFSAEDELGLIYCHLAKQPTPPYKIKGNIPKVISDLIMKLMEKIPENRYQSALGLKSDLEICLDKLEQNGRIDSFKLGKNDFSGRFNIPQKLYGRELEIMRLMSTFDKVSQGDVEIITVSGYSGVGKSSIVNEIHKSVIKHRGFFAMGKNDQLNHDVSYSALIQLFEKIIYQIISENKDEVEKWKLTIIKNLGFNSKVIINVIPSLELIIGPQAEVPDLSPAEAQNRFNLTFKNFVKCFCSSEHPLVMFLDDMQWCDISTMKLLEALINDRDTNYLMIIMTYRDNEVYGAHPLMLTLGSINQAGKTVNNINLKPLEQSHITTLLMDTLHCNSKKVEALSELCLKKTEGNPFFLSQFLQLLYADNLIWFEDSERLWNWDLNSIYKADITDNVIELMIRKIRKLSPGVQEVLTLAACIGNSFDFKILSTVCKKTVSEIRALLEEALIEGLILIDKNANNYASDKYTDIGCHFLHDRIQQAAYDFIEETHRKSIHLELARLMLSSITTDKYEEHICDILNHFNIGLDLIYDSAEKANIATLELIAGKKAKKAIAYEFAYKYFKASMALLDTSCWQTQYELTLSVYTEAAETAYLIGNFDEMLIISEFVKDMAKSTLDKVAIYKIIVQAYAAQGKINDAVNIATKFIKLLGANIPKKPGKLRIFTSLLLTKFALQGKNIEDLCELPLMKDEYYSGILSILSLIGSISYRTDVMFMSEILIQSIKFSLKYGNTPDSPFFYSGYGLVSCALGDIETGYSFGKLASILVDRLNVKEKKSRVIFMNNAFIYHWKEPLNDLLPQFKEGYQSGLEVGDYEFAAYNGFYYCNKSYYAGKNLEELEKELLHFISSIKNLKQEPQLHLTAMMCQLVQNLIGKNQHPMFLVGEVYNENTTLPIHFASEDNTAVSSIYLIKLMLCYLFNNYEEGVKNGILTLKYIESLQSTVAIPTYHFYYSLTQLALYNESDYKTKQTIMKNVTESEKKMKKWAEHGPQNYQHKYYLIVAEKAKVQLNDVRAIEYYNLSIDVANKNSFIQDEALANELLAVYYLSKDNKKLARFYMECAHYAYTLWGASAKTLQLGEKYNALLYSDPETSALKSKHNIIQSINSNVSSTSASLDIATIVKSSQVISGEIKLEELLKKLIYILHENSGAQKVVFIMKQNEDFKVVAQGHSEEDIILVMQDYNINDYDLIPKKIINYVIHSKQSLIIDNSASQENYIGDPYIAQYRPKSLLCMPIINKTELIGILYLENNLIEGAFTKSKIEILMLLSAQLAISIDNAYMYQNLEILNGSLEQKVQKRTIELKELLVKVYSLLDNSGEGFLSFSRDFVIDSEYSSECISIFGKSIAGDNVLELLFANKQDIINTFVKSINIILETDDDYRKEILMSLLPSVLNIDTRFIKVKYRVLENFKIMLILTDITREIKLEEKIKEEQERLKLIVASFTNKDDFFDVIDDYRHFMGIGFKAILNNNTNSNERFAEIYRNVHTFKGIFSQFSFINIPKNLDLLETSLTELRLNVAQLEVKIVNLFEKSGCNAALENDIKIIKDILGDNFAKSKSKLYLDEDKAIKLKNAANVILEHNELIIDSTVYEAIDIIKTLHYKNIKEMLDSYPDYALNLSQRLGKNIYNFKIEGCDVNVDPNKYSAFTKSLIHVFRNAIDHGLESPDERIEVNKDEVGRISCSINYINTKLSVIIEDDGKGIDLDKLKFKAVEKGIISMEKIEFLTKNELINLIFADNLSTRETISDISGRGYGLSAVMSEINKLNGTINVDSTLGVGTKFIFTL